MVAGSDAAGKYKKHVQLFEDGSPDQLIKICDELDEIYTQNKIESPPNQHALVESVLRGESKETYLTLMEEARGTDARGNKNPIDENMLTTAMNKLREMVFPYRALDKQKIWMKRRMRKPDDLPVRRVSGAVPRMNDKLVYFPGQKLVINLMKKN